MNFDNNYNYKIISEYDFNKKYLLCKNDGSIYSKYILVFYKEDNKVKEAKVSDKLSLKNYNDVLCFYELEKIISSCVEFDSEYIEKEYYKINDNLCFIKYKTEEEKEENDNEKIKEILYNLKK